MRGHRIRNFRLEFIIRECRVMGSRWLVRLLLLSSLSVGAAACTGSVNLDVTDAPVDKAQNIFVQFSGVTFRPSVR